MEYSKYDQVIEVALINFYTLGNKTGEIRLGNIDLKNKSHLALLRMAFITREIFAFKVKLNMNPVKFMCFKQKYKLHKSAQWTSETPFIDCTEFIEHIEKERDEVGIFAEIYERYYERSSND